MSVGLKRSLFALFALLAVAAAPRVSQAQFYEGSNGWFAGGPIGCTTCRPVAAVPTTAFWGGGCNTCATPAPTTAFWGGGCNTCATPVAVTAFRPGLFGWFRRPVTVVGFAPTSCCGATVAAPTIAAPGCSTCAAPSLASFTPAPSCCGASTVTAAFGPTPTVVSTPAASCCGGGQVTAASAVQSAPATTYYQTPTPAASSAAPATTYAPTPAAAAPASAAPAANQEAPSVYAPQPTPTPAETNGASNTEAKTFKPESNTAPQFNAPLKSVPNGKTNVKGGLFQGPTLVDPEDRTTQRSTSGFAVKQAVLIQPAKVSTARPSTELPLDTDGWRPARAR